MVLAGTIMASWSVLMLHYSNLTPAWLRNASAGAYAAVAAALALIALSNRGRRPLAIAAFVAIWVALVVWFRFIPPSNTREWQADVARPARAHVEGHRATIENVRNFAYRSESDFDVRWDTRVYDLNELDGYDLLFVYWGSPAIAHTMVSFRFRDAGAEDRYRFLPISIEVRKERAESYSTLAGFFRQYELYYLVADERDVVGLRTNYRGEDVYLYRTRADAKRARALLLDYLKTVNELSSKPRWYNALTDNCTNGILFHVEAVAGALPYTWEILLSGYSDRYAYKAGSFGNALTFEALKRRSRINAAARGHDRDARFSSIIRRDLPGYERASAVVSQAAQ
jgi:Domain of unknown function (DUF4105)